MLCLELVGLLFELNDVLKQLDQINPLVSKLKVKKGTTKKEELHYLEVKNLLLLAYSQAITFYFLLKSEGQPVRDHPVIARLVEIKSSLDKTKVLDENLPSQLEVLLDENEVDVAMESAEKKNINSIEYSSDLNDHKLPVVVEQTTSKVIHVPFFLSHYVASFYFIFCSCGCSFILIVFYFGTSIWNINY